MTQLKEHTKSSNMPRLKKSNTTTTNTTTATTPPNNIITQKDVDSASDRLFLSDGNIKSTIDCHSIEPTLYVHKQGQSETFPNGNIQQLSNGTGDRFLLQLHEKTMANTGNGRCTKRSPDFGRRTRGEGRGGRGEREGRGGINDGNGRSRLSSRDGDTSTVDCKQSIKSSKKSNSQKTKDDLINDLENLITTCNGDSYKIISTLHIDNYNLKKIISEQHKTNKRLIHYLEYLSLKVKSLHFEKASLLIENEYH
ncbi:hypothetical protein B5S33_g1341 [[Candida] boidinii]|nr:hypothetical protein B5S33_g1341 [[Candida] boidinii]